MNRLSFYFRYALRSLRRAYHQQLHHFAQTMQRHFPEGTRYSRPQGGNVIWVEFPTGLDTLKLYREALKLQQKAGIANADLEACFRYPGPKPRTKEIGLVMLADAVESTSRSLANPTPASLQKLAAPPAPIFPPSIIILPGRSLSGSVIVNAATFLVFTRIESSPI